MKKIGLGAGVFTIENFLSKEECDDYINRSELLKYEDAAIQTKNGPRIYQDVRNNARVIFDDIELASFIFNRARAFLPEVLGNDWCLSGLNERFRFYRYEAGEYFKWHKDGFYCRTENEISQLTFLIYLNDNYLGGETAFKWDVIKPQMGMALVFPHLLMHQGSEIISGKKYVFRTDVMYKKS